MVDWVHDELLLAADLVSRNGWSGVRAQSAEALALSELLRRGQLHAGATLPPNFRTPSSIQRKTFDIATADPSYEGKRTRGGKQDLEMILKFRADPRGMQAMARAVRQALERGESRPTRWNDSDDGASEEGSILEYLSRRRERDPRVRKAKLAEVEAAGLPRACEVCGFSFGATYGARGDGYIEVRHRRPLHDSGPTRTRTADLVLLCANCHRMCHRGDWITPDALSELIVTERRKAPAGV